MFYQVKTLSTVSTPLSLVRIYDSFRTTMIRERAAEDSRSLWLTRAAVLATFVAFALLTWQNWGDIVVDCGRELLVPVELLRGKVLYRDIYYPFPPLAPYVSATLLWMFGQSITVMYGLGLVTTLAIAGLIFETARRLMPLPMAYTAAAGFLAESFGPSEFNNVLPYSYPASFGSLCVAACVFALVKSALGGSLRWVTAAGLAAGMAVISKQEFGAACCLLLAVYSAMACLNARSLRPLAPIMWHCLPGAVVVVATAAWLFRQVTPYALLYENFQSTPGGYFMREFGAYWLHVNGLRFHRGEIALRLGQLLAALAAAAILALLARSTVRLRYRRVLLVRLAILGFLVAGLGLVTGVIIRHHAAAAEASQIALASKIIAALRQFTFPGGIVFAAAGCMVISTRRLLRCPADLESRVLLLVASAGFLAGFRVIAMASPNLYPIYYNHFAFVAFAWCFWKVVRGAAKSNAAAYAVIAIFIAALFVSSPRLRQPKRVPFDTGRGRVFANESVARQFPQIIAWMRAQRALDKKVLVLPEAPALYFFAGADLPGRHYALIPGSLEPGQPEQRYVRELEAERVDYVLLTNRSTREYGPAFFGLDYCKAIFQWLRDHYELAGEFGDFRREPGADFAVQIWKRRGAERTTGTQSPSVAPADLNSTTHR